MEWMASGLIHKKLFTKEFAMTMNKDASKGLVGEDAAPRVIMPTMIEIEMDENGLIQNCNDICESVIGFGRDELKLRHISTLINMFSHMPVMSGDKLNPYLDFICHCGPPFGVRKKRMATSFSAG